MPNQDRPQHRSEPKELPDLAEADRTNGEHPDADHQARQPAGQSTRRVQSEDELAGVTPPPQTAADEMD